MQGRIGGVPASFCRLGRYKDKLPDTMSQPSDEAFGINFSVPRALVFLT